MFPSDRGRPGAGRGLVLAVIAVALGAAVLMGGGDPSSPATTRLEATQASVFPFSFEAQDLPEPAGERAEPTPVTSDTAGAEPLVVTTPAPAETPSSPAATSEAADAGAGTGTTVASAPAVDGATTPTAPSSTSAPLPRASEVTATAPAVIATTTTATTAPPPPPPPVRTGPGRVPGAEAEVVPLTNRDRSGQGLGALARNGCLDSAASRFAEQMARSGVLAHNAGAGAAVTACRPGAAWGDNVGTAEPCDTTLLETKWMASPGHRRNILTGEFTLIGVGAWTDEKGSCWVQVLFSS